MKNLYQNIAIAVSVLIVMFFARSTMQLPIVLAQLPSPKSQPVESDMHEFMEYAFQPTYKRLQKSIAVETTDKAVWKAIKADALILAEAGNLLLLRSPKESSAIWDDLSIAMREDGSMLYHAAKARDFKLAHMHYERMLTKCNACHDKFAEGKHQLTP